MVGGGKGSVNLGRHRKVILLRTMPVRRRMF